MSNQLKRLTCCLPADRKCDVQLLIEACKRLEVNEIECGHLCDTAFIEVYAPDALDAFLRYYRQSERRADEFLLSLIPPRVSQVSRVEPISSGMLVNSFL